MNSIPSTALTPLRERIAQSSAWQTLRAATWLEWQTRGNWTNPWLFALYLLGRPLSASLVLVFMYKIVSGSNTQGSILGFLIIGSSAWSFVDLVMAEIPRSIMTDREEYAMLKYIYIAPSHFLLFLVGRSIPRMLMAIMAFTVTVFCGVAFLGVPINLLHINYFLVILSLLVGFVCVVALGIILGGLALVLKRGAWQMPDAISGALYLVTGAIFPVTYLPHALQSIAMVFPLTYWIELLRISLLNVSPGTFPVTSTVSITGWYIALTAIWTGIALVSFRICDYYARERGQIDRTTGN